MNSLADRFSHVRKQLMSCEPLLIAAFILSIYFSTGLAVIYSVCLALIWLFAARWASWFRVLTDYPVALSAVILYSGFIIGLSYGDVSQHDAISMLSKYRELLFIPILIPFLTDARNRYWAWSAFILASIASLGISYLMDFGIFKLYEYAEHGSNFKSRITHGIFIAFFAFYCAHRCYDNGKYAKWFFFLLIIALHNLFLVVEARTGQLIALLLAVLFIWQRLSMKTGMVVLSCMVLLIALFMGFSDKAKRFNEAITSTQAYMKPVPEQTESSMGQRYTFWKYSLKLMAEKPLLGQGTGSFAKEYQRIAKGETFITKNPHNEFFMIGVQLGLLGLLAYLGFLGSQWYSSLRMPSPACWYAQGLFLTLVTTSLFNTPFFDHTEGHWFATMMALCYSYGSENWDHQQAVTDA